MERTESNFLEFAFSEDMGALSKKVGIPAEDLMAHQADVKEVVSIWARVYPDEKREKVDPQIWARIQSSDLPRDTAIYTARDIINRHLKGDSPVNVVASVNPEHTMVPAFKQTTPIGHVWFSMIMEFSSFKFYRLCEECGAPFRYTSHKATYCSEACRSAAYRRRRAG